MSAGWAQVYILEFSPRKLSNSAESGSISGGTRNFVVEPVVSIMQSKYEYRELDLLFQANPVTGAGPSLEWLSTSLWESLTRR